MNDALASLNEDFDRLYVDFGRPSIAPERLIRGSLIQIVLSVGVAGATVTQVAQRHEVPRQQLHAWCHEMKKKGLLSPLP